MTSILGKYFMALLVVISISEKSFAWSADGHQVTAMIALKYLDTHGKADVAKKVRDVTAQIVSTYYNNPEEKSSLLRCKQGANLNECNSYQSVAAAAIFPDKVKHAPDNIFLPTASWHFINTDSQTYDLSAALVPKEDEYTHKTEVIGDLYMMINGMANYIKTLHTTGTGNLGQANQVPAAVDWASNCSSRSYGCETEALSFLIHLVGDIHQPLHVSSACDEGGNKVNIKLYGKAENPKWKQPYELHAAWDEDLFTTTPDPNGGENIYTSVVDMDLMADAITKGSSSEVNGWAKQLDPKVWANESLSYAPQIYNFSFDNNVKKTDTKNNRKVAQAQWGQFRCPSHPEVPIVGLNYRNNFLPLMKRRLLQGGTRLAAILNAIYGSGK